MTTNLVRHRSSAFPIKLGRGFLSFYAIALIILTSRGLFEVYISKNAGYVTQVLTLSVLLTMFVYKIPKKSMDLGCFALLSLFAAIGIALSIVNGLTSFRAALAVSTVNLLNVAFLVIAIQVLAVRKRLTFDADYLIFIHIVIVLWVVFWALMQYAGLMAFPGAFGFHDNVRLTGSLGSMQHLSIVLALLSLMSLHIVAVHRSMLDVLVLALCLFTLAVSYTRIGYLIFMLTSIVYFLILFIRVDIRALLGWAIWGVVLGVGAFLVAVLFLSEPASYFMDRLMQIRVEEASNQDRIGHWWAGVDQFFNGLLLVSNVTGMASQIPRTLFDEFSFHYESGHLQYLINFGILFWIIVVFMYFRWMALMPISTIIKPLPMAMLVALLVYMFNEVVPVYVFYPILSLLSLIEVRYYRKVVTSKIAPFLVGKVIDKAHMAVKKR
jgi:hypothetical protein